MGHGSVCQGGSVKSEWVFSWWSLLSLKERDPLSNVPSPTANPGSLGESITHDGSRTVLLEEMHLEPQHIWGVEKK